MGGIAVFMMVTAAVVLVPVVLQIRLRETRLREAWGFLVFALGLVLVGAADTTVGRPHGTVLMIAGVLAALAGLLGQQRRAGAPPVE